MPGDKILPGNHLGDGMLDLAERHALARSGPDHLLDQIDAGNKLGDRMLHLKPGVHFKEPECVDAQRLGPVHDEFYRAGPLISNSLRQFHRRVRHGRAHLVRHAGRRRFLDDFLTAALQRAIALIEMDDIPMCVAEDLDFDMARLLDQLFQHDPAIAEGTLGFAHRAFEFGLQLARLGDKTNAAPPAPGDRLDQQRKAHAFRGLGERFEFLAFAAIAGQHGHARLFGNALGFIFRAQGPDRLGGRADPDQPGCLDGFGEIGILGQEAIARMDGIGAGRPGRGKDGLDLEIAFGRRRRADMDRLIGLAHMFCARIGVGIDGDRRNTEPTAGLKNAAGDLAPIRDEQLLDLQCVALPAPGGLCHVRPPPGQN